MPARLVRSTVVREEHAGPDQLLDVYEAAKCLGLKSSRTLYKWTYEGRIRSYKIGRNVRFLRSDVERLKVEGERPAFASPDGFPLTANAATR
jgi:excisionase family DNA binding protein